MKGINYNVRIKTTVSFFRFLKLGGDKGHLTRDDLRNCGLESNPLGDRLIGIRSKLQS